MTPEDVAVAIGRHDQRLIVTEKGISNFRDFQAEAREFFAEYRAVRKERQEAEEEAKKEQAAREAKIEARRKELRSNRLTLLGIIVVCLLPPAGWFSTRVVKYADDIYQIIQEWEATHKAEIHQKKSTSSSDGAYAVNKSEQTADLPAAYDVRR